MKKILIYLLVICVVSCASDDNNGAVIGEPLLEGLREANIQLLAGNSEKVWRISHAELHNGQNIIDISTNFNVVDDEFVFTDTTVEWRKGHEIKYDAMTIDEAKQDYYVAPKNYMYSFEVGSATQFSMNAEMNYEIQENGSVTGVIEVENEAELHVTLVPKTTQDYMSSENTMLQFTEEFTVQTVLNFTGSTGMLGSNSQNSIYIATQENIFTQKIIKIDMNTLMQNSIVLPEDRFSDKKIHVAGDRLTITNSLTVDHYDSNSLQYLGNGVQNTLTEGWQNFGSAIQGDDVYIVGGRIHGDRSLIYKYNLQTQSYTEFANLPEDRFGAGAVIVGNHLYAFGGKTVIPFFEGPEQNTIYIVPLDNPNEVQTLQMTQTAAITFVKAYQNLIYIASVAEVAEGVVRNTISVFNTFDNTYQDLSHDLDTTNPNATIQGMCLIGDKMYVIYGENTGGLLDWSVYAADLN